MAGERKAQSTRRALAEAIAPNFVAANAAIQAEADAQRAQNGIPGEIGALVRNLPRNYLAIAKDIYAPKDYQTAGMKAFARGFLGSGSPAAAAAAAKPNTAKPAVVEMTDQLAQTGRAAVDAALTTGRRAQEITPRSQIEAAVGAILSRPFSIRDFKTAADALPALAAGTPRSGTNKDAVFGAAAARSAEIAQRQLAMAQQAAQAGTLTAEQLVEYQRKVEEQDFQRLSALVGSNPLSLATALQLGQGEEE